MGERAALGPLPETALWTLHHRAIEARRPDGVLRDPLAPALVDAIEYPFAARFGSGGAAAQWQALRALCFDVEVRRFLRERPGGTVVALGEGLETQFWRVDDGRVAWVTVDLPEILDLRRRLLPGSPRLRAIAGSAAEGSWIDSVDRSAGLLVTAQGLLMYLAPAQVHRLVAECARRLAGAALVFDGVPRWFSALTVRGVMRTPGGYRAPPMPWALDAAERRRLRAAHPNLAELRTLPLPRGRGIAFGAVMPLVSRLPGVRGQMLQVMRARFGPGRAAARR